MKNMDNMENMENKKGNLELIYHYKKNKEYKKGIELLENLVKQDNDICYLHNLADIYYNSKDYSKAEYYIKKVLNQNPTDNLSLLIKAKLLMKNEKYNHALEILLNLYNLNNNDINVIIHTGICYLKINQLDNAIHYLNKAISKSHRSSQTGFVYYYLSTAYYKKENNEKAVELMEKAYEISGSNFYYTTLIKYKIAKLHIKERIKELMQILKIESKKNIPDLHIQLAENLLKNKQFNKAVDEFYTALKINPSNQFYKDRYVYSCNKAGKFEIVYDMLPGLIKKKPFASWQQMLYTNACIKLNKVEKGLEFYYDLIQHTKNKITGKQIKTLKKELKQNES